MPFSLDIIAVAVWSCINTLLRCTVIRVEGSGINAKAVNMQFLVIFLLLAVILVLPAY